MLACSELKRGDAGQLGAGMARHDDGRASRGGRPFTAVLLDCTGGSGARGTKDGLDAGGLAGAPAMAIANVETYEKEHPILYVYRNIAMDTGGHGLTSRRRRYASRMIIPHGGEGADRSDRTVTHGASQPEPGLATAAPSSVQVRLLLRKAALP